MPHTGALSHAPVFCAVVCLKNLIKIAHLALLHGTKQLHRCMSSNPTQPPPHALKYVTHARLPQHHMHSNSAVCNAMLPCSSTRLRELLAKAVSSSHTFTVLCQASTAQLLLFNINSPVCIAALPCSSSCTAANASSANAASSCLCCCSCCCLWRCCSLLSWLCCRLSSCCHCWATAPCAPLSCSLLPSPHILCSLFPTGPAPNGCSSTRLSPKGLPPSDRSYDCRSPNDHSFNCRSSVARSHSRTARTSSALTWMAFRLRRCVRTQARSCCSVPAQQISAVSARGSALACVLSKRTVGCAAVCEGRWRSAAGLG